MGHDLIIGRHAICAALKNPERKDFQLFATEDGLKALGTSFDKNDIEPLILSKHDFQNKSKQLYQKFDFNYQKISGGALLLCSALSLKTPDYLYRTIGSGKKLKIIILDGITDIHNAGAIVRTASFYGVDMILAGGKLSFGMPPAFFRIASGGIEHLAMVQATSLPRVVKKMQELGTKIIALTEKGDSTPAPPDSPTPPALALILGAEDRGISHALLRLCPHKLALKALGHTRSLNVSVAAAVAMERFFSCNPK